jgi:energy-coupling factor transport system permease protein
MNNIALGRYLPLDSCIHRLDPRTKIIALILMMVAIFLPAGWVGYALLGCAVLCLTVLAN